MSFDETFLPFDVGEQVLRHDLRVNPIFTLLERKYSIPVVGAQYKLEAVAASAAVSKALEIRRGSPIFQIRTHVVHGKPSTDRLRSPVLSG